MSNSKTDGLRNGMSKVTAAIQSSKPMNAISQGFMSMMAIMMAGAVFTLIDSIPVEAYQAFLVNTGLKAITSIPINVTTNLIALYVVFCIASKMAEQYERDGMTAGIIALMSFLTVTPMTVMGDYGQTFLPTQWLGAAGVFVAIILGLVTARIYVLILDKNIYIKMPAGVPPIIERSFAAVVPGLIIMALMMVVRGIFSITPFGSIHTFVFGVIQKPLTGFVGASIPSAVLFLLVGGFLWFFGIHGNMIVFSLLMPILAPLAAENLVAFNAGLEIPNMITSGTFMNFGMISGSGVTIGLVIAMMRAKSQRYRTLGRLGIIPGICGINEPIIFGTPLVLNIRFFIPFVLLPVALQLLGLLLTLWGILPPHNGVGTPLGTPIIIMGFLTGGWRVALFQAAAVVVSYFAYLPAFKKADAEAYAEEQAAMSTEETKA